MTIIETDTNTNAGTDTGAAETSLSPTAELDLMFRVLHRGMRMDSTRLAASVASLREEDRTSRGQALVRWFEGFSTELHDHHTIEDDIFFPALSERMADAPALVSRVDTDHEHLSDLIDRTTAALARLADPAVPFRSAHAEAVMVTDGLRALLDAHLGFEDREVVPCFGEHFEHHEYEALHQQAGKRVKPRHLLFVIPWAMSNTPDDEQRMLLKTSPFFFRLIWIATRGRYSKLTAAAFGC